MMKGLNFRLWMAVIFFLAMAGGGGTRALAQAPSMEQVQSGVLAKAALLYDPLAQKVIFARDPNGAYAPASTTKLMTALMVMERNGLGGVITVMERDTWVEPSHVPLVAGETVRVKDLISALLIGSDNDCAMALGRKVGGDLPTFINMMNQRAKLLGCRNTNFVNPNGLPAKGQFTTANDLLLIFQKVISIPELRRICETQYYDLRTETGYQRIKNHNKLLGVYPGMGPAKTGWTVSSRHTYAASCTRNGRELQLIILNSSNKWADSKLLFDYGFSHLSSVRRQRDDLMGDRRVEPPADEPAPLIGPVAKSAAVPAPAPAPAAVPAPPVSTQVRESAPPAGPIVETSPRVQTNSEAVNKVEEAAVEKTPEVISYVVKKGDTLSSISRRFSSSVERIQQSNPDVDPLRLVPGMILHIPKSPAEDA